MPLTTETKEKILRELDELSDSKIEEVLDFIEYLKGKDRATFSNVDLSSLLLQQQTMAKIWNSQEEDLYEL